MRHVRPQLPYRLAPGSTKVPGQYHSATGLYRKFLMCTGKSISRLVCPTFANLKDIHLASLCQNVDCEVWWLCLHRWGTFSMSGMRLTAQTKLGWAEGLGFRRVVGAQCRLQRSRQLANDRRLPRHIVRAQTQILTTFAIETPGRVPTLRKHPICSRSSLVSELPGICVEEICFTKF